MVLHRIFFAAASRILASGYVFTGVCQCVCVCVCLTAVLLKEIKSEREAEEADPQKVCLTSGPFLNILITELFEHLERS